MNKKTDGRRLALRLCAMGIGGIVVGGCSVTPGTSLEDTPEVVVVAVGAALEAPVWSYATDELIGLTRDHRLAKVRDIASHEAAQTTFSPPLQAGRNVQVSAVDKRHILVPQPQRGTVAVVNIPDLRPIGQFDAGPAPAYLSEDAGMRILLALSSDGSSVTPVDLHGYRRLATAKVSGAETIDGATRGRAIEYHLYGPAGISYYKGPSSPPKDRGNLAMKVDVAAGDRTKVTRSYVATRDDNMLYAVDVQRDEDGLQIVGHAQLPSPIRYLVTDDTRIYAATDRELVTLQTVSFAGYHDNTIPVLRVVNYRQGFPGGQLGAAPVSGMAVGPDRVYLTFGGTGAVASIAKPRL